MASRAEKKLAKLKAQEELRRMKAETRERRRKEWDQQSKATKITVIAISSVILFFVFVGIVASSEGDEAKEQVNTSSNVSESEDVNEAESTPKSPRVLMLESIVGLINSQDAYDVGSYAKGAVPVGEYVYIPLEDTAKYYSEEDTAGNIVDNENFDSFGYVYVQGVGNLQTQGVLIKTEALQKIQTTSAKEIFEKLNETTSYNESGMYKVGTDLAPGTYTIESYGQSYLEIMSGPVGNSQIIDNEIFDGTYSVTVSSGQYLKISRGKIIQ